MTLERNVGHLTATTLRVRCQLYLRYDIMVPRTYLLVIYLIRVMHARLATRLTTTVGYCVF